MAETQVFKRGQIWYINDNRKNIGSIQGKSRPYLVVSNDKCNMHSPVIHMAPITTQDKSHQPTHVTFFSPKTRSIQTILLEQTMPKSVPDIASIADYQYSLSEEKMTEVDKALAIQFGIPYGGVSMDDFEELLDMIKEKKLEEIRAEASKLTTDKAEAYTDKLLEAVDKIKVEAPSITSTTTISTTPSIASQDNQASNKPLTQIEKFNQRLAKANKPAHHPSEPTKEAKKSAGRRKSKWTDDRKKEFISDAENPQMTTQQVIDKYHISLSSYHTLLSKFRKEMKSQKLDLTPTYLNGINIKEFMNDYDSNPVSEVMSKYGFQSKSDTVKFASQCRIELEG